MRDFQKEDEQFRNDVINYGWLNILSQLTNLDTSIKSFKKGGAKGSRHGDFCPEHGGKKGDKFYLLPDAEQTGAGWCMKCKERYDGFEIIKKSHSLSNFSDVKKMIAQVVYSDGEIPKIHQGDSVVGKPTLKPKPLHNTEPKLTKSEIEQAERLKKSNNILWKEGVGLNHPDAEPARAYFQLRGIDNWGDLSANVRFHSKVKFYEVVKSEQYTRKELLKERNEKFQFLRNDPFYVSHWETKGGDTIFDMGYHPALLFLMRDNLTGKATAIQRVYLSNEGTKIAFDGKFDISVKKITKSIPGQTSTGASCHIDSPTHHVIGVAEGPETTLAVRGMIGMPMNCTVSAGGLANWKPLPTTDTVYIFEDKDKSLAGRKAALKLKERLESEYIRVFIISPPIELEGAKSVDWQDCVQKLGMRAFPDYVLNWDQLP